MSEKVILSDQPSNARAKVVWPLMAILLGAPFLIVGSQMPGSSFGTTAGIVAVVAIVVADVALILDQRSRNATVYMLTPTRILRAWGTGKRYQQAVPLAGIQSVTVQQSPVGRMLNYGTLVIESSEVGQARIVNVPRPREWEKAILEARR